MTYYHAESDDVLIPKFDVASNLALGTRKRDRRAARIRWRKKSLLEIRVRGRSVAVIDADAGT